MVIRRVSKPKANVGSKCTEHHHSTAERGKANTSLQSYMWSNYDVKGDAYICLVVVTFISCLQPLGAKY